MLLHDLLELVVVVLQFVPVRLHLPFVVLQRRLELLLEVRLLLRLHLSLLTILGLYRLLVLSLILDGGSHHGGEALGELGGKL